MHGQQWLIKFNCRHDGQPALSIHMCSGVDTFQVFYLLIRTPNIHLQNSCTCRCAICSW